MKTTVHRKWYKVILWWELLRIPYNILMYGIGYLSFYISYINIPLVYLLIGFLLNVFYTGGWINELLVVSRQSVDNREQYPRKKAFLTYLLLSVLFVLSISVLPLVLY
jgi:hypothetical protein